MEPFAILKWAAGSVEPLPLWADFDEDLLLDLVDAHNLAGRFLSRLAGRQLPWATRKLRDALHDLHAQTRLRIVENAGAIREIAGRLPRDAGVVVIKGMSTYALVAQEHTMRCGDIDILCSDGAALVRVLTETGYRQTRAPFLHELGEFSKGAVEVDVHDYFPAYSYPESLLRADLNPERHPERWCQSHRMQQHQITYDDLRSGALEGRTPETVGVNVPDPNVLAIILCSHAFLNYTNMWSISHREKAYVRLGEIADLFDLARHPAFSRAKFLSLMSRFGANDAAEWAACVASSLLGRNPLPVSVAMGFGDELPDGRFPRCLWWNFWADLPSETDDFLRRRWLDMGRLVAQLGANALTAAPNQTRAYSTAATGTATRLRRIITQTVDKDPIPLGLEVSISDRGLLVDLQVTSPPGGHVDRVRVDLGYAASEWIHPGGDAPPTLVGAPAPASFTKRETGYCLSMNFTWEVLARPAGAVREIPMLVGVAKQAEGDGVIASTLLPLRVNFQE